MLDPQAPTFVTIPLPGDQAALASCGRRQALLLSAVFGANPRLGELLAVARERAATLLIDPKTAHFQFEGYLSMPDYRELRYGAGHGTLGTTWKPDRFGTRESRRQLIDEVLGAQRQLGADVLMAPYFYVPHAGHRWLGVAHDVATEAAAAGTDRPVGAVVCVDIDGILDVEQRATVADAFTSTAAAFYVVIVVNFDERRAGPGDVGATLALLRALIETGKPVLPAYVGRTGLLAVAEGAAGYGSGTHGLEAHPRRIFREMMGSAAANRYYLRDWKVILPVRRAEAVLRTGVEGEHVPCPCAACEGSVRVTRMVSRRLAAHAVLQHADEVHGLAAKPAGERLASVREQLTAALGRCEATAGALAGGEPKLAGADFHYLEVLREAAGGPPASIPAEAEPPF